MWFYLACVHFQFVCQKHNSKWVKAYLFLFADLIFGTKKKVKIGMQKMFYNNFKVRKDTRMPLTSNLLFLKGDRLAELVLSFNVTLTSQLRYNFCLPNTSSVCGGLSKIMRFVLAGHVRISKWSRSCVQFQFVFHNSARNVRKLRICSFATLAENKQWRKEYFFSRT